MEEGMLIRYNKRVQKLVDRKRVFDLVMIADCAASINDYGPGGLLAPLQQPGNAGEIAEYMSLSRDIGIRTGVELAAQSLAIGSKSMIFAATIQEGAGSSTFYFVGSFHDVCAKLKKLPDNWISTGVRDD
jgi:hypothetical protein